MDNQRATVAPIEKMVNLLGTRSCAVFNSFLRIPKLPSQNITILVFIIYSITTFTKKTLSKTIVNSPPGHWKCHLFILPFWVARQLGSMVFGQYLYIYFVMDVVKEYVRNTVLFWNIRPFNLFRPVSYKSAARKTSPLPPPPPPAVQ